MKAIILCAGFGTRLNPITQGAYPKALITIGSQTILDLLIENIKQIPEIDETIIVSNNKYYSQFLLYKEASDDKKMLTILNDGTNNNDERLGAIGDINFALEKTKYSGETMVLCADNWFDFKLKDLYDFYLAHNRQNVVFGKKETEEKILRAGGVALLDKDNRVQSVVEKPKGEIVGDFAVGPFYIYNSKATSLIKDYCKKYAGDHSKIDAPGNYPAYLTKPDIDQSVYAYDITGFHCIDMGTPEQYEKAQKIINKNIEK